jgi:hypothetical protein
MITCHHLRARILLTMRVPKLEQTGLSVAGRPRISGVECCSVRSQIVVNA